MTESQRIHTETPTPEAEHLTHTAWMFDVDGVATDPETKQLDRDEISEFIADRIKAGEPVGLITGRALKWVMDRVVPKIKNRISDTTQLSNFYVSGEFGGSYTVWYSGIEKHYVDPEIRVPKEIIEESVEALSRYTDTHNLDPDKETMVSLEMNDGLTVAEFKPKQLELAEKLKPIIAKHDHEGQFEVHVDRIATNIRDKRANKYYAAEQFVKWATGEGKKTPQMYFSFGDSKSDTEMPKQLSKMNLPHQFVFVGGRDQLAGEEFDFPVQYTENHCDEGVVEFISKYNNGNS